MRTSLSLIIFLIAAIATVGVSGQTTPNVAFATIEGRVLRVIDGDTIELHDGETVRLLGINTPEMGMPLAMDAKLLAIELLGRQDVRLELDEQKRDVYGRLLAYVYVEIDEVWILANTEIVRAGLAELLFIPPNMRYYGAFQDALSEALIHRRGLFASISGEGALSIADLECSLVECVTEIVTVQFIVSDVLTERKNLRLSTSEGEYGFHVLMPLDSEAALAIPPADEIIGQVAEVTGVLDCSYRDGPSITVESPDQISYGLNETQD